MTQKLLDNFTLNLSIGYREDQGVETAIRELVTNAQDITPTGYWVEHVGDVLTIHNDLMKDMDDCPMVLERKHWVIGVSGSRGREEAVGTHGEGLKIGTTILLRLGFDQITIYSGSYIYKPYLREDVVYMKMYETDSPYEGTRYEVQGFKGVVVDLSRIFLHQEDDRILFEDGTFAVLYEGEAEDAILYVGRTKVCTLASVNGKGWRFSYNTPPRSIKLGRDRNSATWTEVRWAVMRVWENVTDIELWQRFWQAADSGTGEADLPLQYLNLQSDAEFACKEGLKRAFGEDFIVSTNPNTSAILESYPEVTIRKTVFSDDINTFLIETMGLKTDEEVLQSLDDKLIRNMDLEGLTVIDRSLNSTQAVNLRVIRNRTKSLADFLNVEPFVWDIKVGIHEPTEGEIASDYWGDYKSFITKTALDSREESTRIALKHMVYHFYRAEEGQSLWSYSDALLKIASLFVSKEVV